MKWNFVFAENDGLEKGLARVLPLLGVEQSLEGAEIRVIPDGDFFVTRRGNAAELHYTRRAEIFRGLSLLRQHWAEGDFSVAEKSRFDSCGIMIDCSRGAVAKPETIEWFQCKMALMGANLLMLYTEDTYEVPGRPYFGYLRGRYTQDELRRMDESAWELGIEMIPCIQTLAHLERALQWWRPFVAVRDTADVLYVGKEETYRLLDEMIAAASAPFRSKRIHIGMDEAFGLGLGRRLSEQGYTNAGELMRIHLREVEEILAKHGLEAMMWSDMFFHACSPGDMAYAPGTVLTDEVLAQIPPHIQQVYWHYYSETEDNYDFFLGQHDRMPAKTAFAGAVWSWNGHATDYRKAFRAAPAALRQCEKHEVRDVFITAWMDDGAEASIRSLLLGMQLYSEYNYTGTVDPEHLERRFAVCAGASARAFYNISLLNAPLEFPLQQYNTTSAVKTLLYEDPLMPVHEADFEGLLHEAYFSGLAQEYDGYAQAYPEYAPMFAYYRELARTAALKCVWHNRAAVAVRAHDREAVRQLGTLADELIGQLRTLSEVWSALWYQDNKPFGFEVLDIRLGGCINRFYTAKNRLRAFAEGELADLEELTCEKLPYLRNDENEIEGSSNWGRIASACRFV